MYRIEKNFEFSASHQLDGLHPDHQCARLHGHNYIVKVILTSPMLNSVGFVYDYGDLKFVKEMIDEHLDHRHLNDKLTVNPTAENMARWFAQQIRQYVPSTVDVSVGVSETPKTWAYFVDDMTRY